MIMMRGFSDTKRKGEAERGEFSAACQTPMVFPLVDAGENSPPLPLLLAVCLLFWPVMVIMRAETLSRAAKIPAQDGGQGQIKSQV